jgi:thiol-disulfide isomerase/thioredoxin
VYPDGERSINFEAAVAPAGAKIDPLQALVGQPIEIEGVTLDGKPINSEQFKGKVVLIDFWTTWCGPCRTEMPNVDAPLSNPVPQLVPSGPAVLAARFADIDELHSLVPIATAGILA